VDAALATSIGLDEEALGKLMSDIGFARTGGAWRWRGRRGGARPDVDRRSSASHAFAELAKLKKK
jgi:ATP-dependent RNA helicase SUPV3L1/SUV3